MNKFKSTRWARQIVAAAIAAALPFAAWARQADDTAPPSDPATRAESADFLRVTEIKGKSISLEIATRNFVRADGPGPTVGLVAVAHIGDRSFYRTLQKLLAEYEVVLYESVKPPGTGGAGGETDEQKIQSTKEAMRFIAGMIESQQHETNEFPENLQALREFASGKDARLAAFISAALIDAWGRPFDYELKEAKADVPAEYTLISLGADGKTGGEDADADLDLAGEHPPDPMMLSKDDGLQSQLADALGLEFQLEALAYDEPNWRCSDMAMDELNRRLEAKGLDFNVIGGTLAGSSMPAKIIKFFLAFMKVADTLMEGAIADTFKVVMIEILGDPRLIDQSMAQFGEGFEEVILEDRNQVAIDDLKAIIEREPNVKSVAILYGAAHMPDMAMRLEEQLGYKAAPPEEGSGANADEQWVTAIKVDLANSKVSAADLNYIRSMIKQAMRQQMRRQ